MNPPLKVGVAGCGRIARLFHLAALASIPEVKVAALAEPDAEALAQAKQQHPNARACRDYEELIGLPELDAVVICLPSQLHAEAAAKAFAAGRHVYLEKPAALDLPSALTLESAWKSSGKVGMMGFNYRWHPLAGDLRQQIRLQTVGTLVSGRSSFCSGARELPAWKQKRSSGGGVLLDLASHHFDLLRFFTGAEIERVRAATQSVRAEADTAWVEAVTTSGLHTQGFFSLSSVDQHDWEFHGREGKVRWDRIYGFDLEMEDRTAAYNRRQRILRAVRQLSPRLLQPYEERSFENSLKAFVSACLVGEATAPTIADGIVSLRCVLAAERSSQTGEWVNPALLTD